MVSFQSKGIESWQYKLLIYALILVVVTPIMFSLLVPTKAQSDWEEEIADIENTYYRQSGKSATNDINIWPLTGIYTPYSGGEYAYTEDGWIYGELVNNPSEPTQYVNKADYTGETFTVTRNPANGLYYYLTAPSNRTDIKTVTTTEGGGYNYDGATIYSAITMDTAHQSDIFFTTASKTETDRGYYYEYGKTGGQAWRYAFQPLSNYETTLNGTTYKINSNTSSLSLIWYTYQNLSGIAGQLTITGGDQGVSYLTSNDIIRAYNSANYSASFTMTFNNIPMHLLISLNPTAISKGVTVAQCWDLGYWSVMVYSEQDLASSMSNASYNFSIDNMWNVVVDLFTFRIADDYAIDGWEATLASLMFTMPLYAAIIAIGISQPLILIVAAIAAALAWIQGLDIGFNWPF